nr:MAG TPA: hypothetical protein [Caudoviricetes sp.]
MKKGLFKASFQKMRELSKQKGIKDTYIITHTFDYGNKKRRAPHYRDMQRPSFPNVQ